MPRTPSSAVSPGEISASQAAERLGLTKQAIGIWSAKAGAPVRRDGTRVYVRWPDFARWREEELVAGAKREAPSGSFTERRQAAEARAAEVSLARAELALERELGESVAVTDYGAALGAVLDRLTAGLRGMPAEFARFGPDVEAAAEREVERLVVELHGWDEDVLDEAEPATAPTAEHAA
jgi:hypothetical protein